MAVAARLRSSLSLSPAPAPARVVTHGASEMRFPALDGFRGLAALGVVLYHVAGNTDVTGGKDGILPEAIARLGNYGVTVFFVLSGFLVYRRFVLAEFRGDDFPNVRAFYWQRFLRIFPAYWLALTVTIILSKNSVLVPARGGVHGLGQYLELYSLTQNYRREVFVSGLFVAWTLCIEVAYYLVLPPIAWVLRRLGDVGSDDGLGNVGRRLRVQLVGLLALAVFSMLFRWWALTIGTNGDFPIAWLDGGPIRFLPSYLDWYAWGMLAAVISVWAELGGRVERSIRAVANAPWLCVGVGAVLYAYTMMLSLPRGEFKAAPIGDDMAHYFFNGMSAFFLLVPGFLGPQHKGVVRRFMGGRVMGYIGLVSYGLYLWHAVAIDHLSKWRSENFLNAPNFWVWLAIVLAFGLAMATLSYYLLERPLMRYKNLAFFVGSRHPGRSRRLRLRRA